MSDMNEFEVERELLSFVYFLYSDFVTQHKMYSYRPIASIRTSKNEMCEFVLNLTIPFYCMNEDDCDGDVVDGKCSGDGCHIDYADKYELKLECCGVNICLIVKIKSIDDILTLNLDIFKKFILKCKKCRVCEEYDFILQNNKCFKCLKYGDESFECSICKDCNEHAIHTTPCNHKFHKKCLILWYNEKESCPLCRSIIPYF